jgi:predicted membrane channel-forming protein YqfA (hemolysin III family)
METKILIKDVIINESVHLSTFLEGQNSQVLFNMYFLNFIQMFSLNVFYNLLKKCRTHSSCKKIIYNRKTHLKGDDNTQKM